VVEVQRQQFEGDIQRVAAAMELTPRAVYLKLKELGIEAAAYRRERGRSP
jgi:two-component system response regulator HydG